MSNFSTKMFSLIGGAMLFAGMSFAQCPGGATSLNVPPILDRFEDTTALVSDVIVTCTGASAAATGSIVLTLNEPVTSKSGTRTVTAGTLATGNFNGNYNGYSANSDAVAIIFDGVNTFAYPGVVSGSQVVFPSVVLPSAAGGYVIRFSNIRVNSSLAPNGNTNFAITESIFIQNAGVALYASPGATTVGYVVSGFGAAGVTAGSVNNYVICNGNPVAAPTTSFSIKQTENFGGAFKTMTGARALGALCGTPGAACSVTNGEQGSYTTASLIGGASTTGLGTATHGTRFAYTFNNIPQNVTIWMPITVTNGTLTMALGSAGTGAFTAVADNRPTTTTIPAGYYGFTSATGTATVYYDVTDTDNTVQSENYTVTGYVTAAPNFASTAQPAITLTVTPAPTGATDIPTFASQSPSALTLSAFGLCQTNLLFPYVISNAAAGFETGIAISNTGLDPFSGVKSAPGACNLNFYGTGGSLTGAAALAVPTPAMFTSPVLPGSTSSFVLGQVNAGFSGYMIAQCNFQYAHGFAYISNGTFGTSNVTSMGYLAEALQNARGLVAGIETPSF